MWGRLDTQYLTNHTIGISFVHIVYPGPETLMNLADVVLIVVVCLADLIILLAMGER
jgi:hypothetical protein